MSKYELRASQILEIENSYLRETLKTLKNQIKELEKELLESKNQLLTLIKTKQK